MASEGFQLATAYVRVVADTAGVQRDVDRSLGGVSTSAGRHGGEASQSFRGRFLGGFKGLGVAAVAGIGVSSLSGFLKDSVTGWQDHQRVMRQTQAVLKSTRGAAGITAKQMGALSDSIEANTGVDGDNVLAGQNMLATFTNVRNGVGKGNDIFNQATKVMTDMSVAMGTDTKTSAIQLGKALNDPVKGISALSKVGVTFDAQQKKQIANYVKSGETAKAQGIILKELNKEFGGSAKAQETTSQKMEVAMHSLEDTVGKAVTPVIEKVSTWVSGKFVPALQLAGVWAGKHLVPILKEMAAWIGQHVIPVFVQFGNWFMQHLPQIKSLLMTWFNFFKTEFKAAMTVVMVLWNQALKPLVGWIQAHWSQISTTIKVVFLVAGAIIKTWAAIVVWLLTNIIIPVFKGIIATIKTAITVVTAIVKGFIAVWRTSWNVAKAVYNAVKTAVQAASSGIGSAINTVKSVVGTIGGAFSSAYSAVKRIVGNIVSAVTGLPSKLGHIAGAMGSAGKSLMTSFWTGLKSLAGNVGGVAGNLWNAIRGFLNRDFIDKIRGIGFSKWGVSFHPFSGIPHFAHGGPVVGAGSGTSDSISAMLSNGEYVINARSAAKYGPLLNAINGGKGGAHNGGYANGGSVNGNAATIAQYLMSQLGLTKAQAAGFLGNFKVESGFNTHAYNGREGAIGLAQWEGGRRTALQNYATSHGLKETDLAAQLGYLKKELTGGYKGVLNQIKGMNSPSAIAAVVDAQFERSSGSARGARMSAANTIYNQLQNGGIKGGKAITPETKASAHAKLLVKVDGADSLKVLTNLFGNVKTLGAATKQLLSDVRTAVTGSKGGKSLVTRLAADTKQLMAVATQRATVQKRLAALNSDLANQRAAFKQTVSDIKGAFTSTFDISTAGSDGGVGSADRMIASLKNNVAQAKAFAKELAKLAKMGLNKTLLAQLAQAGPGSANAMALANASASQISQINSLYGQLGTAGTQGGTAVANDLYGAKIAADTKAIGQNTTHLQALNTRITNLGKSIDKLTHSGALDVKKHGDHYSIGKVEISVKDIADIKRAEDFFKHLKTTARAGSK